MLQLSHGVSSDIGGLFLRLDSLELPEAAVFEWHPEEGLSSLSHRPKWRTFPVWVRHFKVTPY